MENSHRKPRWRFGLLAAAIVTFIAVAPQLFFCLARGSGWNGAYAQTHGDETVYAAYLNALTDGRARRSNPFSGRDDSESQPVAESYLSVQFVPPLLLARIARLFHLSTTQVFVGLTCFTAFVSALAVFWLLSQLLRNDWLAATGVLVVILASSSNLIVEYLLGRGDSNNYLPFLRRYLPAFSFPFVFLYFGFAWRMLTIANRRKALLCELLAGIIFSLLTFSYFYHWSFVLVWTICLATAWLITNRKDFKRLLSPLFILTFCVAGALASYVFLVRHIDVTSSEVPFLVHTHRPDLFRLSELVAFAVLVAIAAMVRTRRVTLYEPAVIFSGIFALTPIILFNQQTLTGRSLQPFHYEDFIGIYTTSAAVFVLAVVCARSTRVGKPRFIRWLLAAISLAAVLSGAAQATLSSRRQWQGNIFRDESYPALRRLAALGHLSDGRLDTNSIVFAPNIVAADTLGSVAPQPVLWSRYLFVFPDVTIEEDRERLAEFLYYRGVTFDIDCYHLESLDSDRRYYLSSLISRGRFNPRLTVNWKPISPEEVQTALDYYARFVAGFDRQRAARYPVSYLLVAADETANRSNFDRWYERDQGEPIGAYVLYRVRLRQPKD